MYARIVSLLLNTTTRPSCSWTKPPDRRGCAHPREQAGAAVPRHRLAPGRCLRSGPL